MATLSLGNSLDSTGRQARAAALAACILILSCHRFLQAADSPSGARPATVACSLTLPRDCDEIWVVSSRGLGCPSEEAALRMKYWQRQAGHWTPSSREVFLTRPADMTTSFFMVGNAYTHAETIETGWFAYCRLIQQAPESPPLRWVIWSWPSDHLHMRHLPDAKIKLTRCPAVSYYMAWLVDQLPVETPLSMSGSSFGARIIMGSLELLSGGRSGGYSLADRQDRRPRRVNAVLMGAAFDNDDLLPGQPFGRSLSQVNRLLLFVNSSDRALKFYRYLFGRRSGLQAIGRRGIALSYRLGPDLDKIETREVSDQVGPKHGAKPYFQSPSVVRMMQPFLLAPPSESQVIEALGR